MASRKKPINWSQIEMEYLSGEYSIREIADRHEISEGAIRKRAKAGEWPKPVRKARTVRTAEAEPKAPPPPRSDPDEPREANAIADDGRNLVGRMLDELDAITSRRGELEDMIILATQDDEDDTRRDAMMKALSLPSRSNTMKTLALALKTLNEASAPQGKKAAAQERANAIGGGSRFAALGPPTLKAVK